MGYNLYLTRKEHWFEEDGDNIPKEEWLCFAQSRPELTARNDLGDDYWALKNGDSSWLCWSEGNLESKNPSPEFIYFMLDAALSLRAKVEGDDGEVYEKIEDGFRSVSDHEPPQIFEWRKTDDGAGFAKVTQNDPAPLGLSSQMQRNISVGAVLFIILLLVAQFLMK